MFAGLAVVVSVQAVGIALVAAKDVLCILVASWILEISAV